MLVSDFFGILIRMISFFENDCAQLKVIINQSHSTRGEAETQKDRDDTANECQKCDSNPEWAKFEKSKSRLSHAHGRTDVCYKKAIISGCLADSLQLSV